MLHKVTYLLVALPSLSATQTVRRIARVQQSTLFTNTQKSERQHRRPSTPRAITITITVTTWASALMNDNVLWTVVPGTHRTPAVSAALGKWILMTCYCCTLHRWTNNSNNKDNRRMGFYETLCQGNPARGSFHSYFLPGRHRRCLWPSKSSSELQRPFGTSSQGKGLFL